MIECNALSRMEVVVVGICTIVTISVVNAYPNEDEEVRAISRSTRTGGNAANMCKVLSQFDKTTSTLIYSTNDRLASRAELELKEYGVHTRKVQQSFGYFPESHIIQSKSTGSRTIVHYRNLPELSFEQFRGAFGDLKPSWIHFEGRNVQNTKKMMAWVTAQLNIPISVEIEKDRGTGDSDVLQLTETACLVVFSKAYFEHLDLKDPFAATKAMSTRIGDSKVLEALVVCWGADGSYGISIKEDQNQIIHIPTERMEVVEDSTGVGDTYNAALIWGYATSRTLKEAMEYATIIACIKLKRTDFHIRSK